MLKFIYGILLTLFLISPVSASDDWKDRLSVCDSANRKETCQTWISQTKMPDNRLVSCCGEADAFITDGYELDKEGNLWAIFTEDYPTRESLPNQMGFKKGDKIQIPNNKINDARLDGGNPSGHSVTFINPYNGQVYCYFGPTGV